MKIVIDTNILLTCFSSRSATHWIWKALSDGRFSLVVTNDILLEYEEIIGRHMGEKLAHAVLDALLELPNVEFVHKYFYWYAIDADPDDNKFVDCAIAGAATFMVSEDRHFQVLHQLEFPKVQVIGVDEFQAILDSSSGNI